MILVTGGAGYIGTHTLIELCGSGLDVLVLDNFSNGSVKAIHRVEAILGNSVKVIEGDIRDKAILRSIFEAHPIDSVVHFAGLKAVGESVANPLRYYDNNVNGTLQLLQVMAEFNCLKIVFSSSATVYGDPETVPITEDSPLSTTNPYGSSKLMIEDILRDTVISDPRWSVALLRYFNPVGAHESGLIGEDPHGEPNNLVPYIARVAIGTLDKLRVFGDDYPTHDGTGVRDYIHVVDLAKGHVAAIKRLDDHEGLLTVNLGTGTGYSVLEMVSAFTKASGQAIPYEIVPRRPGDIATCYADPTRAREMLGWSAERTLDQMCADTWRWQKLNPNGFDTER